MSRWRGAPDADAEQDPLSAGSSWFAPPRSASSATGGCGAPTRLVAAIATYSRVLVMDEAERARTLATIRDFLHGQPETSAGEFTLPLVTVVLRTVRRP